VVKGRVRHVDFRRRREGKTDYYQRKELVKSGKARLVVRCTLSHSLIQFIKAELKGDRVLLAATTREIQKKYGWNASTGNIPATYLTGFLAGLKARSAGLKEAILDVGIKKPSKGSKIYAGLKGVLDAGISVPVKENLLPEDVRIRGEHVANYWKKIGEPTVKEYRFSQYLKNNLSPEKLPEHFEEVKQSIEKAFG